MTSPRRHPLQNLFGEPAIRARIRDDRDPQATRPSLDVDDAPGPARANWWQRVPARYKWATGLYLVLAALFIHDWDGFVFEHTVRDLWEGKDPYSVSQDPPYFTYLNIDDENPQWYAYPPLPMLAMAVTFLPEILFNVPAPLERVLLKLPMIAGTLGLALVGGAWARRLSTDPQVVVRTERHLLFNPYLILVGPVWGMTDTALMALFLGAVLCMVHRRDTVAGVLFGLSALVKPFPVLLAIPLLTYFHQTRGRQALWRAVPPAIYVIALVCLPFLLLSPRGFYRQVLGVHLQRDPQGLSLWTLVPEGGLSLGLIAFLSVALLSMGLLVTSLLAHRFRSRAGPLILVLFTSALVLLANRVVNEQYLVLVVAPLLILGTTGAFRDAVNHWVTATVPTLFAAITLIKGSHYVTLIPPDVALPLLGHPVDVIAHRVGTTFNRLVPIRLPPESAAVIVGAALGLIALLTARRVFFPARPRRERVPPGVHIARSSRLSVTFCIALLFTGISGLGATPATLPQDPLPDPPLEEGPSVGAFYYLWWNNPSHDPSQKYGNWLTVSQHPSMGFYTNTRGLHRQHIEMMQDNGIDFAILSYHTPDLERYKVFHEEAAKAGLATTPLIELNQLYDQVRHHPLNETGKPVPYAAYRLTENTREAIVDFVLELETELTSPNQLRVDGKPVVFFYDSYVSGFGFSQEERVAHARALLEAKTQRQLRNHFGWAADEPVTLDRLLHEYPGNFQDLYLGAHWSIWREAHLHLHREFWRDIRTDLEERLGPVVLISGDAYNERAGFEAGTVKSLVNLEVFEGSFIYSPSFTWGNHRFDAFDKNFDRWQDRNTWLTAFAKGRDAYSGYGIAPAYDDTVQRENGFVIPHEPVPGGPSFYQLSWNAARATPPDWALVATFNEFFEGSSIEPSTEFGDRYLLQTGVEAATWPPPPAPLRVLHVVHEHSSRTHPAYSERDLPHAWGLRMIAAGERILPHADTLAVDAMLSPGLPEDVHLVLIDGGRERYPVNTATLDALRAWHRADTPRILFGPQVPSSIRLGQADAEYLLPGACQDRVQSLPGLDAPMPGDVIRAEPGEVHVDRPDGSTYRVGTLCEEAPGLAFLATKPWTLADGEYHQGVDGECLRVILGALQPAFAPGAPRTCTVTGPAE